MRKFITALAIVVAVIAGADARPVNAMAWGCRTVDYGTYAGARCEANDGRDPDRVRVWIICANDPHRTRLYGPWVQADPWNTSWRHCANGARMLSWGFNLGA